MALALCSSVLGFVLSVLALSSTGLFKFSSGLHCYLILVLLSFQGVQSHGQVVYVTPGDKSICPSNVSSCHTLEWYSAKSNGSFSTDNTEVRFLEGMHTLNTSILIENCHNVSFVGVHVGSASNNDNKVVLQPTSWVNCTAGASNDNGFKFLNSSQVHITNLGFRSCGTFVNLCNRTISAALFFEQGNNIFLHQIVLEDSRGVGLHLNNVFGLVTIHESTFTRASPGMPGLLDLPGNARIWFGTSECRKGEQCSKTANTTINSCSFTDGQKNANGLEVIVHCPNVHVIIDDVIIRNNRGRNGGNLALSVTDFSNVTNTNIIKIMNSHISGGRALKGGGMRFWTRTFHSNNSMTSCIRNNIHNILEVHNTSFTSNHAHSTGSAILMSHYQGGGYGCTVKNVAFRFCFFADNFGKKSAIELRKHLILAEHSSPSLHVSFEHCHFHNNSVKHTNRAIMNTIMTHVDILDCTFIRNNGTAVSLQGSKLNVYDGVRFENNHAAYGAAMKICDGSLVFLNDRSHMHFINNTAQMGGAVFVQQSCLNTAPPCVFQPALHNDASVDELNSSLKLEFVNNSAITAGDAFYGGSIDSCYTIVKYRHSQKHAKKFTFLYIFKEIFDMKGQTGPSWVSSDPQGVCFCRTNAAFHLKYKCSTNHSVVDVYPGERFSISAVSVGQLNGSTAGLILSTLVGESDVHQLTSHNDETFSNHCVNLTFTLFTNKSLATVVLRPSVNKYSKSFNASFTVNLLPCPLGFQLLQIDGKYKCSCAELFQPFLGDSIYCDINTQTIYLEKSNLWIGCQERHNQSSCESNSLVVSADCGEYCINDNRNVSITHLNRDQCFRGRTGFLCGSCKPGLSHLLGPSPECKDCSNKRLVEYIPLYLLSGVAIVAILTVLNLTVTEGTINGLIFYTTVMFGNRNDFSPDSRLSRSLKTFILALNLEPGRAGCAYHGMNAYEYIWLKFAYVFYLLLTQAIIIYLTHKFPFFTRLLGKNVLKVLATLLFLGHSQLLFVCFNTLWFAKTYTSMPNETTIVWHFDGTIPYLGTRHALLFVVALFCCLIALLFMSSLFFIQCLQRWSHCWILRWVDRFRPFFEVYTGPCNDSYRFWPGLLYLLRSGIYAVDLYITSYKSHLRHMKALLTSVVCIIAMSLAFIFPHGVYKKWFINVLEFFFLLNVCITSIGLGYLSKPSQIMFYSVIPVAIVFCGILVYHTYQQIKGTRLWKVLVKYFIICKEKCRKQRYSSSSQDEEDELLLPQAFAEVLHVNECREPLLED